MGPKGESF